MSLVEPQQAQERRVSPILPPSGSVNNPFRKNNASPVPLSPRSPVRPSSSRNPFLDNPFNMDSGKSQILPTLPRQSRHAASPSETEGLLVNLSLNDSPARADMPPPPRLGHHHPSHSQEGRRSNKPPGRADALDIFADPPARRPGPERRARRNSDTSIAESRRSMDTDEERKRRERRHREREHQSKDSQGRPLPPPSSSRSKKPSRRLDIIDQLDVTSIYGTGLFHHDGPFDALNPHRNRKGASRAPMQAFPKDSRNNTLGGSGPLNKNIDLDRFHGHQQDSFKDFNSRPAVKDPLVAPEPYVGAGIHPRGDARDGVDRTSSFNPGSKVERLHGDESLGLGTSTFLEGAPAPRAAIERRESETDPNTNGLTRKKSIAQKIRGIGTGRPRGNSGTVVSPEARYEPVRGAASPVDMSAGGNLSKISERERNPFFQDYDEAYDKKGASIRVAEDNANSGTSSGAVTPAPESSKGMAAAPYELKRAVTEGGAPPTSSTSAADPEGKSGGGGFMSRVKSLRGGGRGKARPERQV